MSNPNNYPYGCNQGDPGAALVVLIFIIAVCVSFLVMVAV